MTLQDLERRIGEAKEGSRELDAVIVAHLNNAIVKRYPPTDDFGPKCQWQFWSEDGKHFLGSDSLNKTSRFFVPHYTSSLDAAISLCERVLPGWTWNIHQLCNGFGMTGRHYSVCLMQHDDGDLERFGEGPTPALALCLAIIRALLTQESGG